MDKKIIRFEPSAGFAFWGIILTSIAGIAKLVYGSDFTLFVVGILLTAFFVILNLVFSIKKLGEISEEGIQVKDKEFIKWSEIVSWEYWMGRGGGYLEIKTENKSYLLRGINPYKILKYFKQFVPEKRINFWQNKIGVAVVIVIIGIIAVINHREISTLP